MKKQQVDMESTNDQPQHDNDEIEVMVQQAASKTPATLPNNRTTLGPVRKKKKKKRSGKMKRRGSGESSRSMRSVALPTIEESDSESILTTSSHHSGAGVRITIGGHQQHQQQRKEQVDVEMGHLDISDTSDSSSSNDEDDHEKSPNKERKDPKGKTPHQEYLRRIQQTFRQWVKSPWSLVCLALLLVVLIAAIVGGTVSSSNSKKKSSNLPASANIPSGGLNQPNPPNPSPVVAISPSKSPTSAPVTTAQQANPIAFKSIYINAGGEMAYTDADGRIWSPDTYDGPIYQDCDNPQVFPNTLDRPLYCRERYGDEGKELRYSFRIPRGEYQLVLHFAEIFHIADGERVMDIYINGELVVSDFDIFQQAGGSFRALQLFYTVEVLSGLSLRLVPKDGSDNAKINAIEVHHISKARDPWEYLVMNEIAPVAPAPPTMTAAPITAAPITAAPIVAPTSAPVTAPRPRQSSDLSTIYINAGSNQKTLVIDGETWTSDTELAPWVSGGNVRDDCAGEASIGCSYRFFPPTHKMRYDIPLPNGEYNVLLLFAETFHENIGDRVFHVYLQNLNLPFRRNYDILANAESQGSVSTESSRVVVQSGMLTIAFGRVAGDPLICGIVIVPITIY